MAGRPLRRARLEATQRLKHRLITGGMPDKMADQIAQQTVKEEYNNLKKQAGKLTNEDDLATKNVLKRLPEETAIAILESSDPWKVIEDVAIASGLPSATVTKLVNRMRTRFLPVRESIKPLTTRELVNGIEKKIHQTLEYMDEYTFAQANLRDLAVTLSVLVEKRQLLNHEPTVILSVEERKSLSELIPLINKEAAKRGVTIDATDDDVKAMVSPNVRRQFDSTYRRIENKQRKLKEKTGE